MADDVRRENTQFGFRFGAALVERHFEIDGRVCIGITTDTGKKIQVYVSRTGRSLRVFGDGEWSAALAAPAPVEETPCVSNNENPTAQPEGSAVG